MKHKHKQNKQNTPTTTHKQPTTNYNNNNKPTINKTNKLPSLSPRQSTNYPQSTNHHGGRVMCSHPQEIVEGSGTCDDVPRQHPSTTTQSYYLRPAGVVL